MAKWYLNESGELWRLHDDINEVKKELQEVAELLGLPVEHEQVFIKWQYRGNNTTDEIHEKYIVPIYFPCGHLSLKDWRKLISQRNQQV